MKDEFDPLTLSQLLRRFACVAAIALIIAGHSEAHAASWSQDKASQADALVTRFLARLDGQAPTLQQASLVYGVATGAGLLTSKGYREAAPGVPATAHTVYHVGSLAKQFTAAGVLDLIGRRATLRDGTQLSLELPMSRIFSGVPHWPGTVHDLDQQPVTLGTLLTMTSNLPNFTSRPPKSTDPWGQISAPHLLSEIKKFRPSGWPNTFEYSNTSYFLLAEVIEEAVIPGETAPKAHRAYLRNAIFSAAGLNETSFVGEPVQGSAEAVAIYRSKPVFDQRDWLKGSADITSSIADLARWNAALMAGRVLPRGLMNAMFSDGGRVSPEVYYGMGWFIEHNGGMDVYSHSGLVPGYTAYNVIAAHPPTSEWVSVSILINTDVGEGIEALASDLLWLAQQ